MNFSLSVSALFVVSAGLVVVCRWEGSDVSFFLAEEPQVLARTSSSPAKTPGQHSTTSCKL